jgi:DNA-binding NtrC family response regulator
VPHPGADARPAVAANGAQPLVVDPRSAMAPHTALPAAAMLALLDDTGDVLPLDSVEAAAIRFAISHYRGQMSEVARKLRIGRSTLYRKIDQLGLAPGAGKADVADR